MLHLRDLNLLHIDVLTSSGQTLAQNLEWWEKSERRSKFKDILCNEEKIDPDDVIFSPQRAQEKGLASTVTFPTGNVAPDGCVIKSTAIDPSVLDDNGILKMTGPAKVFVSERSAIKAIKDGVIQAGDIMVLICIGPLGSGMEETFQVTSALKYLSWGKHVALITDGRFSGVSTGACIGHIGPEALAGGPIGKIIDGDILEIEIDTQKLVGTVNLIGNRGCDPEKMSVEYGSSILKRRSLRRDLSPQPNLPDDTRLWAALQNACGGTWGGAVYDVTNILKMLNQNSAE